MIKFPCLDILLVIVMYKPKIVYYAEAENCVISACSKFSNSLILANAPCEILLLYALTFTHSMFLLSNVRAKHYRQSLKRLDQTPDFRVKLTTRGEALSVVAILTMTC